MTADAVGKRALPIFRKVQSGNDYQNKDLIADFKWWVEETGNLDDSPQTGDTSNILLWAVLAAGSLSMMILLLVVRRRKEENANV